MIHYIVIILSCAVFACAQQCVNIEMDPRLKQKTRLTNNLIDVVEPMGLMMCAKQCHYHADCVSWNFFRHSLRCELNYETLDHKPQDVENAEKWYYGTKDDWSYLVKDGCSNHKCPAAHRCHVSHDNRPVCAKVACGPPPDYAGLSYTALGYYPFGSIVTYTITGQSATKESTCQSNGKWTKVSLPGKCPNPVIPPHMGIANPSATGTWIVGSKVIFSCDLQYTRSANQLISECTIAGIWTNVSGYCDPDWCMKASTYKYFLETNICYRLHNMSTNLNDGKVACQADALLYMDSEERVDAVKEIVTSMVRDKMITKNTNIWIDAYGSVNPPQLYRSGGERLSDNLLKYLDLDNSKGNCIYMSVQDLPEMKWRFGNCNQANRFICEKLPTI